VSVALWIPVAVVAACATWFVIAPLRRPDAAQAERIGAAVSEERDLRSRHEMLLSSLKDLEDDRATGKLDDADYHGLKGDLSSQAVGVMKQLDALERARHGSTPVPLPDADPKGPAA